MQANRKRPQPTSKKGASESQKIQDQFSIFDDTSQSDIDHAVAGSTDITAVVSPQFGQLRMIVVKSEPWFLASDVCTALEHSNPSEAMKGLDDDEKAKFNLGLPGGPINMINESGLYALVLRSRKKSSKAFRRWVTHEVLPSIRKEGSFVAGYINTDDIELLSRAVIVANTKIQALEAANSNLKPKALVGEALTLGNQAMSIGTLAKYLTQAGFSIGQNNLFKRLRLDGYLMMRDGDYIPTQRAMPLQIFAMDRCRAGLKDDGSVRYRTRVRVTSKGIRYFIAKYAGKKSLEV